MSDLQTLPIRIGTRGSKLALAQAEETRAKLIAAHGLSPDDVAIVPITTTGDRVRDRPLAEIGGKGLFTKEIEQALVDGEVDLAVHSLKDMPTVLPHGLAIACVLERADPRDAFISNVARRLVDLPEGAVVGTSSVRRQAQAKRLRPDLQVVPFRGNVGTRLRKLAEGEVAATFLACAGLMRLAMEHEITAPMDPEDMLPAIAQGAICLEIRAGDETVRETIAPLDHAPSHIATTAERAFLGVLDGSCRTPIAGLALLEGGEVVFRGMVLSADGETVLEAERRGPADEAERLGTDAGEEVLSRGGADLLA
ncbi:hydroxymethylbilane synthase [Kaustia mangrovi]|uniref:Porphobilinogen deaminase n=2 Tax=Kaustia mangrovi TaxID=2593653 RepID=A0A7S8C2P0_9HYPH|nr:hydroxymethylbilane synthase [Kaustia mangrovi]QPC42242.1 hydroxymethylbilane synthase [Kaustia mangrovi]